MKRIIRNILLVFMFLCLAGCTADCGEEIISVMVVNRAQVAVSVQVYPAGLGVGGTHTVMPGDGKSITLTDTEYTVAVKSLGDWLTWAKDHQAKLEAAVSGIGNNEANQVTDPNGYTHLTESAKAMMDKLLTALTEIKAKIKAYKNQSGIKRCQGNVGKLNDGHVIVTDGDAPQTVHVTCTVPSE